MLCVRLKPLLSNIVYAVGIEIFVPNKWNFFYLPNCWNVIIFIFHYEEGHSELHSNNLDVKQGYV